MFYKSWAHLHKSPELADGVSDWESWSGGVVGAVGVGGAAGPRNSLYLLGELGHLRYQCLDCPRRIIEVFLLLVHPLNAASHKFLQGWWSSCCFHGMVRSFCHGQGWWKQDARNSGLMYRRTNNIPEHTDELVQHTHTETGNTGTRWSVQMTWWIVRFEEVSQVISWAVKQWTGRNMKQEHATGTPTSNTGSQTRTSTATIWQWEEIRGEYIYDRKWVAAVWWWWDDGNQLERW